ncbi:MAG: hypothetical protein PF690_01100 [Deltaproteobacteria bacterium]|jgi:hypothetical protein|nr:hypothetical protein [Deltaproteobacteria bacterium]
MFISYLSEVESKINQYFNSQNTMALADSTKALYNAVVRKKLLPFCKENGITKLNEKFIGNMDSFGEFLRDKKVSAHTIQSNHPKIIIHFPWVSYQAYIQDSSTGQTSL